MLIQFFLVHAGFSRRFTLILKDVSAPEDEEAIYSIVDDDKEMDAVAAIFTDMLEDIELEKE